MSRLVNNEAKQAQKGNNHDEETAKSKKKQK
jgi:hypothetical protein